MSPTTSRTRPLTGRAEFDSVTPASCQLKVAYPFKVPLNAWERLTLGAVHILEALGHNELWGEIAWMEVALTFTESSWALALLLSGAHWRSHPQVLELLRGTQTDKLFLPLDEVLMLREFARQAIEAKSPAELFASHAFLARMPDLTPLHELLCLPLFAQVRERLTREFPFEAVDTYYRRELIWQRFELWLHGQRCCQHTCRYCCASRSVESAAAGR